LGRGTNYPFLTQKERDVETGLDYSVHRYYSSNQGRFTSADPSNAGATVNDAQSWNGYGYVNNSPVTSTDPLGLWKQVDCTSGSGQCWEAEKGDSIGSLAKILNVNSNKLNKFFQIPGVEVGQVYDVSGFYRNNTTVIRASVVQVFLVAEPAPPPFGWNDLKRFFSEDESRARAARVDQMMYDLMVPKCAQEHKCYVAIMYPGGVGSGLRFWSYLRTVAYETGP